METDVIPVLEATPVQGCPDQWAIWCTYCETHHFHGAAEGHRVAHCTEPSSPYRDGGYFITLASN